MTPLIFRHNLKHLRSLTGLSQQGMAQLLGVKRTRYGAWEEGRAYPNVPSLVLICNRLDIDDIRSFLTEDWKAVAEDPTRAETVARAVLAVRRPRQLRKLTLLD